MASGKFATRTLALPFSALALAALSSNCSVLLDDPGTQCSSDDDCLGYNFRDSRCEQGICVPKNTAGAGASAGVGGSGGSESIAGTGNNSAGSGGGNIEPCPDCDKPVALRLLSTGISTPAMGTQPGVLRTDTCPGEEVVIGMKAVVGRDSTPANQDKEPLWLVELEPTCGKITLEGSDPYSISVTPSDAKMPRRGRSDGKGDEELPAFTCPPDHVVVGYEGLASDWIDQLRLRCAKLSVSGTRPQYLVTRSLAGDIQIGSTLGDAQRGTPAFPASDCPPGEIARGIQTKSASNTFGTSLALACAAPVLALPETAVCQVNAQCASTNCVNSRCAPPTCQPSEGCRCELFDSTEYAFCDTELNQAAAGAACQNMGIGMGLVSVATATEDGWLRVTASNSGKTSFWLGASDANEPGQWRWSDPNQTVFWRGDGVTGSSQGNQYSSWRPAEPKATPIDNCVMSYSGSALVEDEAWGTQPCTQNTSFVCKRY